MNKEKEMISRTTLEKNEREFIVKERGMRKTINEMTETEMREHKVPWPKSQKELLDFMRELLNKKHDYGTCVYAVSMASVAMFNFMAGKLGITGFQASCADLNILKRTRRLERFHLVNYNNLLYPQYRDREHFPEYMDYINKNKTWLKKKAKKSLKDNSSAHADVIAHWEWLSSL